ncbi:hypothetical protein ACLMJK_008868 [Lecanora helva]
MEDTVELVDLSLFAESPTNDHTFSVPNVTSQPRFEEASQLPRYRSHTVPREYYINKPLPPLPHRRLLPRPRVSTPRCCDEESRCILKRIQRIGSNDTQTNTLLHRRRPTSPPTLTLSLPQSNQRNGSSASAMIWMPDEQMWLIAGERQEDHANQNHYQTAYPSPPPYSPGDFTRSEPSPTIQSAFDLTPPLTPVQYQLQSLIQPPGPRDEERLFPMFQQAMNSVPMLDPEELFFPPLTIDTESSTGRADRSTEHLRPQRALERSNSDVSPVSPIRPIAPTRSASAGSRLSHLRSDSSDRRSFQSAMSIDLTQPEISANRWAGLARRIASPEPARG